MITFRNYIILNVLESSNVENMIPKSEKILIFVLFRFIDKKKNFLIT